MIISNAPQSEAILSNVGTVGEFKIRNSAKAFAILSSGLYANKIRAIVRELSCNAVDSHVAAGNSEPFEVHMPSTYEPWFAVRDYGTGLSHDQVNNIYTTYFDSSKTNSNDFIGALGLGSKSPFAYTDNFMITAIKNGRKGIYSAFINDQGVPSIAAMSETDTDEANGVEVRFAVTSYSDSVTFKNEAITVYKFFKIRPKITNDRYFTFTDVKYTKKDIIQGVHTQEHSHYSRGIRYCIPIAVMGNIEYPIQVTETIFKNPVHRDILNTCSLVLEFAIGELDFQASREGLSYIPMTVNAITKKLDETIAAVTVDIAKNARAISNNWHRALFLMNEASNPISRGAVIKYITDTKFDMMRIMHDGTLVIKPILLNVDDVANNTNVRFSAVIGRKSNGRTQRMYIASQVSINVALSARIYVDDLSRGGIARVVQEVRSSPNSIMTAYAICPADPTKPMLLDAFMAELGNPPKELIGKTSNLDKVIRTGSRGPDSIRNIPTLKISNNGSAEKWVPSTSTDNEDETYYYVELKNRTITDAHGFTVSNIRHMLVGSGLFNDTIYGVRQSDIEDIRERDNWVNLFDHIKEKIANFDDNDIQRFAVYNYGTPVINSQFGGLQSVIKNVLDKNSQYIKIATKLLDLQAISSTRRKCEVPKLMTVCRMVGMPDVASKIANFDVGIDKLEKIMYTTYPMLRYHTSISSVEANKAISDYINLIDNNTGV